MTGVIITKLQRVDGYWTARVSAGGQTINVDKRYGSWHALVRAPDSEALVRRFVLPEVAAALQERVRPIERAEAQERARVAKAAADAAAAKVAATRPLC